MIRGCIKRFIKTKDIDHLLDILRVLKYRLLKLVKKIKKVRLKINNRRTEKTPKSL